MLDSDSMSPGLAATEYVLLLTLLELQLDIVIISRRLVSSVDAEELVASCADERDCGQLANSNRFTGTPIASLCLWFPPCWWDCFTFSSESRQALSKFMFSHHAKTSCRAHLQRQSNHRTISPSRKLKPKCVQQPKSAGM